MRAPAPVICMQVGSEALDMPGLSYVVSTAEMGLRLALASATHDVTLHASTGFAAMNVMSWVDASALFALDGARPSSPPPATAARASPMVSPMVTPDPARPSPAALGAAIEGNAHGPADMHTLEASTLETSTLDASPRLPAAIAAAPMVEA